MGRVSKSGRISSPPGKVFSFLTKFEDQLKWAKVVKEVWHDTKNREGVWATFTRVMKRSIDDSEIVVRSTVTHWKENVELSWRNVYPNGQVEDLLYTVKPASGGSNLTLTSMSVHQKGEGFASNR